MGASLCFFLQVYVFVDGILVAYAPVNNVCGLVAVSLADDEDDSDGTASCPCPCPIAYSHVNEIASFTEQLATSCRLQ
jgi:hypothetical protein